MEQQPATYADVRIINGDQRQGKSTTDVAFAVDDSFTQLKGLRRADGKSLPARWVNKEERSGLTGSPFRYAVIFGATGESKIVEIPIDWTIVTPVKIFANFHLYGVPYVYISLADIIQYINTDLFNNSWILSDESVMTDARNSMDAAGKIMAAFGATIGKRNAHMCLSTQYNEQIERRYRLFHTMRVLCSYEKSTKMITCDMKKRGEPSFSYDYYAPNYWPFFKSEELIPVPQEKIDRALAKMYAG